MVWDVVSGDVSGIPVLTYNHCLLVLLLFVVVSVRLLRFGLEGSLLEECSSRYFLPKTVLSSSLWCCRVAVVLTPFRVEGLYLPSYSYWIQCWHCYVGSVILAGGDEVDLPRVDAARGRVFHTGRCDELSLMRHWCGRHWGGWFEVGSRGNRDWLAGFEVIGFDHSSLEAPVPTPILYQIYKITRG